MEHIDIQRTHITRPTLKDSFTPLVAKGLTYQVGEALRRACYESYGGHRLPLVPEATLRGAVEQYQDLYIAALQTLAGTFNAKPPKDNPMLARYTFSPTVGHGIAVTIGRMYKSSEVVSRRTRRLRECGLITTKGKSSSYEVNFLAANPYLAKAVLIGFRHAIDWCDVDAPWDFDDEYLVAADRAAQAKCAELASELGVTFYPAYN
nr:MAG TPA: hypothetical protein [Caudoviricetes sp.]